MPFSRRKKKLKNQAPTLSVVESESVRNAAQALYSNIQYASIDEPIKLVAVTSSAPNEGKSTITLALAQAAGATGKRVLVIEGDLRRRSLRAVVGVHPRHGIHAAVTGEVPLSEAAVETKLKGVSFLDAEAGIPNPEELLSSKRFEALLDQARADFDLVVLDTPPVGAFADAAVIGRSVDGIAFVVREDYTDKRDAQLAVEQLRSSGSRILGLVMNCTETHGAGGYGYYYGYYYEEKSVPADSPEAQAAREQAGSSGVRAAQGKRG